MQSESSRRQLPAGFIRKLRELEDSYLLESDPIRQSGFGGGPKRWREEREPILEAVDRDGCFLDVGCANGYLLECLLVWAAARGTELTPFGLDTGSRLIELAKERMPDHAGRFFVGNAWDWIPPRLFDYVYTLHDCVPRDYLEEYIQNLLGKFVVPGGRLILGSYGSRSRQEPPFDVVRFLHSLRIRVMGSSAAGDPIVGLFAWVERDR